MSESPTPYHQLTGPDFVECLGLLPQIPPLFSSNEDLYRVEGPRVYRSGLLPYDLPDRTIDALVWDDGLMLVSPRVFEALGGQI